MSAPEEERRVLHRLSDLEVIGVLGTGYMYGWLMRPVVESVGAWWGAAIQFSISSTFFAAVYVKRRIQAARVVAGDPT